MATTNKDLAQPVVNTTNWDVPINANTGVIDAALGGNTAKNVTGVGTTPVVLTTAEYQKLILTFSGTLTANVTYHIPSGVGGQWIVRNATSGAFTLTIGNVAAGTSAVIPQGLQRLVYLDGTNIRFSNEQPVSSDFTTRVSVQTTSAATNTTTEALILDSQSSGTPAAGIGTTMSFAAETAAGNTETGMQISAVTTDVTSGSEDFDLVVNLMTGGAPAAEMLRVSSTGLMTLNGGNVVAGRTSTGTDVQSLAYAGITSTADNDGTQVSGTYTPTPVGGNFKTIGNGGAFTLAAPSAAGDYTLVIQITNVSGAGAITLSGFNRTIGSSFTTVVGDDFFVYITKVNSFTFANVVALQ